MGRAALLALALLAGCATVPPPADCAMSDADRAWLAGALKNWSLAETQWLGLEAAPLPDVVAIDAACSYTVVAGDVAGARGTPHGAERVTVGERELPIGPISFADGSGQFVMSLPSVWRAAGVDSPLGLERLMEGVLLHEIMHTRQSALATAALERIEALAGSDIGDDTIQETFADNPDYVAAYEAERDLLYAAANATDETQARDLARQALDLMRARRARYFTGDRAHFGEMEDVFLTMEGMGQYLLHRHFAQLPGVSAELALAETRRGGYWSQDEGYALFAVLDRLLPDWRMRAFREPDWRARNLLEAAVER